MKRQSPTLVVTALLVITASVQGNPPESFGGKGTVYSIGDDQEAIEVSSAPTPSDIVWGPTSDGYRACDFARAGNPQCPRSIAIPSNTRFYSGYYVGGGTPTHGAGRSLDDGTWGWDYSGNFFPKRIALNWTAKGRSQGGAGAYKTDNPKLRRK